MFDLIEKYFAALLSLPPYATKEQWEKVYNDMAVHTRKAKPDKLLLARRPNEEENIFNYRLNNYEPITYGSMNKALDDLFRIINGISYSLNCPQNVSDFVRTIVLSGYNGDTQCEPLSLGLFLQKIALKRMIEDPNGWLVWLPSGEGLIDSSKKVVPSPKLVYSCQYHYSDNNVFIYKSDEKSPLSDGNGGYTYDGDIYIFLTRNEYWKMYQTGTMKERSWSQDLIYTHNLGAFPIITLGGDMNSHGFYESYFSPYLAFGNEAIRQFSDWQAVMTTSSFPYIEEFANECTFEMINKQSNHIPDTEEKFQGPGGGANGKYYLKPLSKSPHNITYRKIPRPGMNEDVLDVQIPSRRFISPDINVAKYSGEAWQLLIEKAETALNIDMTVGVDQSGKAKQLDKEAQYSMITKIGNNFYDNIFWNSLKMIDGYLNRITVDKTECSINKPTTFWIKNELDLIHEISTLKTSNAPSFFLAETTTDLAKKRFSGNPVNEKIFSFIALYDPYFVYTTDEKNSMLAGSIMTKDEYIKSLRMYSLLQQIVIEKSPTEFVKMEFSAINDLFEIKVADFLPEEANPQVDPAGNPI